MTPKSLLINAIDPALALLEPLGVKSDNRARLLVLAIAGQESAWQYRRQNGGPARSFWQFERGGGVAGLFHAAPDKLNAVCAELYVPFDPATVFEAMAWNDVLAASMARLLLWTDPAPMPEVGDIQGSWNYYERNWRPGAPRPNDWPALYGTAMGVLNQQGAL
jgi:hypothetical protein